MSHLKLSPTHNIFHRVKGSFYVVLEAHVNQANSSLEPGRKPRIVRSSEFPPGGLHKFRIPPLPPTSLPMATAAPVTQEDEALPAGSTPSSSSCAYFHSHLIKPLHISLNTTSHSELSTFSTPTFPSFYPLRHVLIGGFHRHPWLQKHCCCTAVVSHQKKTKTSTESWIKFGAA